ncbi:DNA-binding beta-propeller fold protein YncE [Streptomyces zagrosensis]|uniref:DNA-binding beta-propeller fold protein YncE n=2 Tax=Streptomyces zagrosensis TaxID=1042984 RepID=A0A7W9UWV4_9ACTN|nr:DNA-binding beta-propeller fold protein YncE [Streptomyces zagrosensis]
MLLVTTALAALALPVSLASANADSPKKPKKSTNALHNPIPKFGAYNDSPLFGRYDAKEGKRVVPENNSMSVSPDEKIAVVTRSTAKFLVVIDLVNGKEIAQIHGYANPRDIQFAANGDSFTVSDSTLGVVDRIGKTESGGYQVKERMPLGAGVFGTAQSDDGKRLFANNFAADTVTVVAQPGPSDPSAPPASSPKDIVTGFDQPRQGVKLAPSQKKLYVTNYADGKTKGSIKVLDVADPNMAPKMLTKEEITGLNGVRGLSISQDNEHLYAANSADDTIAKVTLVDGGKPTVETLKVDGDGVPNKKPYGAVISPDETVLFTGNEGDSTVTAINPETGAAADLLDKDRYLNKPRQAIAFSANSATAWALNADLTIAKIDVAARSVTEKLGKSHPATTTP